MKDIIELQKNHVNLEDNIDPLKNIEIITGEKVESLNDYEPSGDQPYQYVGHRIFSALTSVVLSELIVNNTVVKKVMKDIIYKNIKNEENRKNLIKRQIINLTRKMIQYNSIIFTSKVILDEHYKEVMQKNQAYYQSNQLIHYKIGAMIGGIAYFLNIPLSEWQNIRNSMFHYEGQTTGKMFGFQGLKNDTKQFFTVQTFKRMINNINSISLAGVVVYRMIYFGAYEKIKSRYDHPINEYFVAPLLSSVLGLLVSPLDYIKFLQMTSHKDKSVIQIVNEKGVKIWNIPNQRISVSVFRQTLSMSFFVIGQKLCKSAIKSVKNH